MAAKRIGASAKARLRTTRPRSQEASHKIVVGVLSAGAPHSPLMAGALYAIHEKKLTFNLILTSGAGAIMGLLFMGPKGKSPPAGLRDVVEIGVSDAIYRFFPLGYKTFFKASPFTKLFADLANRFKVPVSPREIGKELSESQRRKRLYNDSIDFWFSALTPTSLTLLSKGLCAPPPFLDDLIDFHKVNHRPPHDPLKALVVNAYNIDKKRMDWFSTPHLNAAHLRAAFAFPFIYPPAELGSHPYYEGATYDPLDSHVPVPYQMRAHGHPRVTLSGVPDLDTILQTFFDGKARSIQNYEFVIIDILGSLATHLVRAPRDLWDAYGLSIMVPIVALAKKSEDAIGEHPNIHRIRFHIPEDRRADLLEWNYSNLAAMFDIGYAAGLKWIQDNPYVLPEQPGPAPEPEP
jgi:NTE family protein